MSNYIDGFVIPVPTVNKEIYTKHAEAAAVVFKDHGALKLVECWGDDVPEGKLTSFPMAVQCKDDETVVFLGLFGLHAKCVTKAWKKPWPTHGCHRTQIQCILMVNG